VLDPDHRGALPARPVDQLGDVRDDRVALVGAGDDAVLCVDDEERGVGPLVEGGHDFSLRETVLRCA